MWPADQLIVIGAALATFAVGESDAPVERSFAFCNVSADTITLAQGYTSCGCTTIDWPRTPIAPNDTDRVTLRFNPKGRDGEFYESGTVVYGAQRQRLTVALQGTVTMAKEQLLRRYPVVVNDRLRLSTNEFDLGILQKGQAVTRHIAVLNGDKQESIEINIIAGQTPGRLNLKTEDGQTFAVSLHYIVK